MVSWPWSSTTLASAFASGFDCHQTVEITALMRRGHSLSEIVRSTETIWSALSPVPSSVARIGSNTFNIRRFLAGVGTWELRSRPLELAKSTHVIDQKMSDGNEFAFIVFIEAGKLDIGSGQTDFGSDAVLILLGHTRKSAFQEGPHIQNIDDEGNIRRTNHMVAKRELHFGFECSVMSPY